MVEWDYVRWEYLVLTVAYVSSDDGGQVKLINGELVPDWRERNARLPQALAYYGERGWELATAVWRQTGGDTTHTWDTLYILKRPKPTEEPVEEK